MRTILIVERFDRQLHSSGRYWLRLMQEDFAQARPLPGMAIAKTPAVLQEVQQRVPRGFPQAVLERLLAGVENAAKSQGS